MSAPTVHGQRLGLVVGSSMGPETLAALLPDDPPVETTVATDHGEAVVLELGDVVVLHRHHPTVDGFCPAHRLDHHLAIAALAAAGCDRVLALGSVGSLRTWPVGTLVAPFDFFAPGINPTYYDDARGHSVPGFDEPWRDVVLATWDALNESTLLDGGVYAQTSGPRFETPAEVRMLAMHADIVGMTLASECILAKEAGLAYAAVCAVDNMGNGLADQNLSVDDFHAGVASNHDRLVADLGRLLPRLAQTPRP